MPSLKSVSTPDFVSASRAYAEEKLGAANGNQNKSLSKAEQKKLPKDLRDDVQFYRDHVLAKGQTVPVGQFLEWRDAMLAASAKVAQGDDGKLGDAAGGKMLDIFRDNLKNYRGAATHAPGSSASASSLKEQLAMYASGLIYQSENEDPIGTFSAKLGAAPSDEKMLSSLFPYYGEGEASYDVDRSEYAWETFAEGLASPDYDPESSSHLKAELELIFQNLEDITLLSETTDGGALGSGATLLLAGRIPGSKQWVGLEASAAWS